MSTLGGDQEITTIYSISAKLAGMNMPVSDQEITTIYSQLGSIAMRTGPVSDQEITTIYSRIHSSQNWLQPVSDQEITTIYTDGVAFYDPMQGGGDQEITTIYNCFHNFVKPKPTNRRFYSKLSKSPGKIFPGLGRHNPPIRWAGVFRQLKIERAKIDGNASLSRIFGPALFGTVKTANAKLRRPIMFFA